jgi:hypothetical protein
MLLLNFLPRMGCFDHPVGHSLFLKMQQSATVLPSPCL